MRKGWKLNEDQLLEDLAEALPEADDRGEQVWEGCKRYVREWLAGAYEDAVIMLRVALEEVRDSGCSFVDGLKAAMRKKRVELGLPEKKEDDE